MRLPRSLCLLLPLVLGAGMGAAPLAAAEALALGNGEQLTYRVGWGLLPVVGRITIAAALVRGPEDTVMRVITTTATRGVVRGFFPFDAQGESLFDATDGRLLASSESSSLRDKNTKTSMVFNYAAGTARFTDDVQPKNTRTVRMPPGDPSDLILGLVQTRSWQMRPGEARDELVLFDDDFYRLTIHALGYEDVATPLGMFHTLVLAPRMEKEPPKGMFKRGSAVCVWIAQDTQHLPVRFTVEFKFGRGIATLTGYRPPTASAARATHPAGGAVADLPHATHPRP